MLIAASDWVKLHVMYQDHATQRSVYESFTLFIHRDQLRGSKPQLLIGTASGVTDMNQRVQA